MGILKNIDKYDKSNVLLKRGNYIKYDKINNKSKSFHIQIMVFHMFQINYLQNTKK